MIWWLLLACPPPTDDGPVVDEPWDAGEVTVQVDCPRQAPEGLAVRFRWPREIGWRDEALPVVVRLGGLGATGWQVEVDAEPALSAGLGVVQLLAPGETSLDGFTSGGLDDRRGVETTEALACTLAFLRGREQTLDGATVGTIGPAPGWVIATGLSLGGDNVVHALAGEPDLADGVVLWESPLVDQVIVSEISPGVPDPLFVPGTCTLDDGCPVPGRAPLLRWLPAPQELYQDVDQDGTWVQGEPRYKGFLDPTWRDGDRRVYSRAMLRDVAEVDLFGGNPPGFWPTAAGAEDFWADRDCTDELVQIRDGGHPLPWIYVANGRDHVQLLHEHVRLAQEGLSGAFFFRLNADAKYTGNPWEVDAFEVVDDPQALASIPNVDHAVRVLAAELELVDRRIEDDWRPDL